MGSGVSTPLEDYATADAESYSLLAPSINNHIVLGHEPVTGLLLASKITRSAPTPARR
jgi:hypothetical protein